MPEERSLPEIIADLPSEQIVADGVTTMDEIDAARRAKGLDPHRYDYLYD